MRNNNNLFVNLIAVAAGSVFAAPPSRPGRFDKGPAVNFRVFMFKDPIMLYLKKKDR